MPKSSVFFYAVKKGNKPGIYKSWPECQEQVKGYPKAVYKKFPSWEEAQAFVSDQPVGAAATESYSSPLKPAFATTLKPASGGSVSINITTDGTTTSQTSNVTNSSSSIEKQLNEMRSAVTSVQESLNNVIAVVDRLSSSVHRIESTMFINPTANPTNRLAKRAFHTSPVSSSISGDNIKKHKADHHDLSGDFTGKPFPEEEGTHVYTDGGCFDNGRNGAKAGIGVYWAKDDPDNVSERLMGRQTNNRAEIHAAVSAVETAKRKGIRNLVLHTDSQFLINGITKWIKKWKKNGWILGTGKPVINKDDFEKLDEELDGINVKWVYVKGHSGDKGNDAVDALAKSGASKWYTKPDPDDFDDSM